MKKALIVGASGLLGEQVARLLEGQFDVIRASASRSAEKVDVSDYRSIQAMFSRIGAVDAIVSTAGMVRFSAWSNSGDADWAHGLANKLMGQVNLVRYGVPFLVRGGSITLTSGVLAQHPMAGSAIVTTVNAAVEGFVRAAAVELGALARVNAVSPGWISETLAAMGKDPAGGVPAADVAALYVRLINSADNGQVISSGN